MARPDFTILPHAVSAWRHERGLTQRDLARLAEVTPGTIARIETSDLSPSWFTFVAIANALRVKPTAIALIRRAPEEVLAS